MAEAVYQHPRTGPQLESSEVTLQSYKTPSVDSQLRRSALSLKDFADYVPVAYDGTPPGVSDEVRNAPHARLDTAAPTSHNRSYFVKKDLTSHNHVSERHNRTARRERVAEVYHSRLIELLREMESSGNFEDQQHANSWLQKMSGCPGRAIRCDEDDTDIYEYNLCRHPLCSHSQSARSSNWAKAFRTVWEAGYVKRPKFYTFSPPNLDYLDNRSVRSLRKVLSSLFRLRVARPIDGAISGIEINYNPDAGESWNLHAHVLADAGYIAHYPMSDLVVRELSKSKREAGTRVPASGNRSDGAIRPFESYRRDSRGRIKVRRTHEGLAREFTRVCQKFAPLASPRGDFSIDNPDHWYFVDLRSADRGSIVEVTKYITKSSTILSSSEALMTYVRAISGNRMLAVHGSFYNQFEVDGRSGHAYLVNMCDSKVRNKNGDLRKCCTKNEITAATCKNCGSALSLAPELAEAVYLPDDLQDPDDPPPDVDPLIRPGLKVSRRYDCPNLECPKPNGKKTYLDTGPPRVVFDGVFRLVANLETGNSQVVRDG